MVMHDINGYSISDEEKKEIINKIIELLSKKNITHAIAYMILDDTKKELSNTIVKKYV